MIVWPRCLKALFFVVAVGLSGCATMEENPKKNLQLGLITTPPTYYTTQKARYLGEKYKTNLDRLVERIVRNPKTANLQFANNIASVGGIGFFTHSATTSVDERFLEIIMGVPDTFDSKLDHGAKIHRVFSLYGEELLSMLASDSDIYQEKEVNGYGLNLSWRNLVSDAAGPRISLERSTLYFPKARVRSFLRGDLSQNAFLAEAVIFAVVDDGPMKLVSYRPQELKPDSRRSIQEEPLIVGRIPAKPEARLEQAASLAPVAKQSIKGSEQGKNSPLPNDNSGEAKVPTGLTEKLADWNEVRPAANNPGEAPVASSAPIQASTKELKELSVAPLKKDVVVGKQESADRASLASLEQNNAETENVRPGVDLASLPVSPALVPITDALKVEGAIKDPLKEQPLLDSREAKTAGAQSLALPSAKVLQGFVIQLAFGEMAEARRWAEALEQRGFAVSLTEVGGSGAVRVRIGNFTGRDEAERKLHALRQDGLKGIVLNLPQAYRPEVHPAVAEESGKTVSAVQ